MTGTKMKALVAKAPQQYSIEDVAQPEPGPYEMLCQVRAVSICGTDAHLLNGDYPGFWPPDYPFVPGHEWAGEIVQLGSGAESLGWQPGDRVAGTSHDACGFCQKCVEGQYNLCENYGRMDLHRQYGHNFQGAFAEYVVHGAKAVFRLPDAIDFDTASLLDPASIALHTAVRGQVKPGDSVVVFGPGPVGLLAADSAAALGAGRVIVVGRGARLEFAREMGHEVVDYLEQDPVAVLRTATDGFGLDVALDCAGVADSVRWSLAALRKGGRCAMVGIPVTAMDDVNLQELVLYEKELVGSRASAGEMRRVLPLVERGRIRAEQLVTHRFALEEFDEAIETFTERRDGAMKVVIEP